MVLEQLLHLRSLTLEELKSYLDTQGVPSYRSMQICDWLHKKHALDWSELKNLPESLLVELKKKTEIKALELLEAPESSDKEPIKYLMRTKDRHILESVLIVQGKRRTICVSTQLGCKIRCSFCASGEGPFGRNLSAGEIVEQISVISRRQSQPITNVVFMGMGEPLDNYEATMKALEILTAHWGLGLGGRRITVSTSGLTPKIERFVKDSRGRVRLSVSLHSSKQDVRSELVPINKKYRLDDLVASLRKIRRELKREITFEYTLIKDINDTQEEAMGVARIAALLNAKVNLIPYNPIREMRYKRPSQEAIENFRKALQARNVRVTLRQTAGADIDAACGQLRLDRTA